MDLCIHRRTRIQTICLVKFLHLFVLRWYILFCENQQIVMLSFPGKQKGIHLSFMRTLDVSQNIEGIRPGLTAYG